MGGDNARERSNRIPKRLNTSIKTTVPQPISWQALISRWLTDNQIVLGRADINGDTAHVEVSFLDRVTRIQYYNKMQLVFRDGRWVIRRFRTM